MYVYIGKDVVVKTENIIGIFDIEKLEKKNSLENVCKNLGISDKIIDVSEDNQKSLIIVNKNNDTKGYISNISTITLGKRTSKYERMNK